jgi:ATPase components of various ABC-type transport systems, contain duplicated ATPase
MSALLEVRDLVVRSAAGGRWRAWSPAVPIPSPPWPAPPLPWRRARPSPSSGESGSGKTTLARALIGLTPAASGSVLFQGQSTLGLAGAALKRLHRDIAMIFQDPVGSLSPRFTVRGLLAEPFRIHGLADRDLDAEVERLLGLVGLPRAMADRLPHQLSGGQARRVGVARAMRSRPSWSSPTSRPRGSTSRSRARC